VVFSVGEYSRVNVVRPGFIRAMADEADSFFTRIGEITGSAGAYADAVNRIKKIRARMS